MGLWVLCMEQKYVPLLLRGVWLWYVFWFVVVTGFRNKSMQLGFVVISPPPVDNGYPFWNF